MPLVGVVPGVGAAGGSCVISIGEPAGTKRAGAADAPLVVASFTGIPLRRNEEPDGGVGKAMLPAAFVPA